MYCVVGEYDSIVDLYEDYFVDDLMLYVLLLGLLLFSLFIGFEIVSFE